MINCDDSYREPWQKLQALGAEGYLGVLIRISGHAAGGGAQTWHVEYDRHTRLQVHIVNWVFGDSTLQPTRRRTGVSHKLWIRG